MHLFEEFLKYSILNFRSFYGENLRNVVVLALMVKEPLRGIYWRSKTESAVLTEFELVISDLVKFTWHCFCGGVALFYCHLSFL